MTESLSLRHGLQRLRRRKHIFGFTEALGWGFLAVVIAVLLGAWADLVLDLAPAFRALWIVSAALLGLAVATRALMRTLQRSSQRELARRVDEVVQGRGQVLSGVDLLLSGSGSHTSSSAVASGLALIAIDRAAGLLGQAP